MLAKIIFIQMLLCPLLLLTPLSLTASDYDHTIKAANMVFQWKANHKDQSLHVRLTAQTQGWASIGFSDDHKMEGANFIIGYVKSGEVKIRDDFGVRKTSHIKDSAAGGQNNVSAISGSENDGVTTLSFTIPFKSGDDKDMDLNVQKEVVVMLAYGHRDNFYSRHKFRTSLKVNLSTGKYR